MNKKQITLAWLIFFGALFVEIFAHYAIRIYTQIEIREYEPHWFLVQILLALLAGTYLIKATKNIKPIFRKVIIIGLNIFFGYVLYLAILLWYVIGTGLDSL